MKKWNARLNCFICPEDGMTCGECANYDNRTGKCNSRKSKRRNELQHFENDACEYFRKWRLK
jgi:hypothetical protein